MASKTRKVHDWREWRRRRAWELGQQGWYQTDIAEALAASRGAVSKWLARARQGGVAALRAHPGPGPPAKLTAAQQRLIPEFLWHGAEAYGFRGDVWTCARVRQVIAWEFGVWYHQDHVSRLLKQLHWTPQVPVTRALQRDPDQIERWRTEAWPALRDRARRERRALVFVDEAGFYRLPGRVKTYGPQGFTPVLDAWQTKDHLSVMGGLTRAGKFYTLVRPDPLTGVESVAFLLHLLREVGRRLLVIWDGSPIHRGAEVKPFLAGDGGRGVHLEALPPYAPDLNPMEWAWQHLKHVELRNLVCLDLEDLHLEFDLAVGRLRHKRRILRSCFAGAGLVGS